MIDIDKRLPDSQGWWARKDAGRIKFFLVEDILDQGFSVYVSDIGEFVLATKLSTPLTRWAGPFFLPWKD